MFMLYNGVLRGVMSRHMLSRDRKYRVLWNIINMENDVDMLTLVPVQQMP